MMPCCARGRWQGENFQHRAGQQASHVSLSWGRWSTMAKCAARMGYESFPVCMHMAALYVGVNAHTCGSEGCGPRHV